MSESSMSESREEIIRLTKMDVLRDLLKWLEDEGKRRASHEFSSYIFRNKIEEWLKSLHIPSAEEIKLKKK